MNLQNHFLIAMPNLNHPFFKKSVIYIWKHNKDGAMGIMINKPIANLTIKTILNKLKIQIPFKNLPNHLNKSVIIGGPISENRGVILHSLKEKFVSSILISNNIFITSSQDVLEYVANCQNIDNILMILGHCVWKNNQLEKEILNNIWLTSLANTNILFHTPLSERWMKSVRNIGIDINRLTTNFGHA
ncbi:MAG: YqgE/AlgH family protein [Buchnera aphidicola (Meitanaphis elongallis)]